MTTTTNVRILFLHPVVEELFTTSVPRHASLSGFYSAIGHISHGVESNIETKNLVVAEADRDVVSLLTQIRVPWGDVEGKERFHVFDIVKVLRSGFVMHEAVKLEALQEASGIDNVMAAFRAQCRDPRMLFRVVDEDMLPRWRWRTPS